jgi:hypothetical protein
MSVGDEAGFRSAWAGPASLAYGGWLGSLPEGAYHDGLAGQIRGRPMRRPVPQGVFAGLSPNDEGAQRHYSFAIRPDLPLERS